MRATARASGVTAALYWTGLNPESYLVCPLHWRTLRGWYRISCDRHGSQARPKLYSCRSTRRPLTRLPSMAGARSNGSSKDLNTTGEFIDVDELTGLCEKALKSLGYSPEEAKIKTDVSMSCLARCSMLCKLASCSCATHYLGMFR